MPATMAENARDSALVDLPGQAAADERADEPTADEEERDWEVDPARAQMGDDA